MQLAQMLAGSLASGGAARAFRYPPLVPAAVGGSPSAAMLPAQVAANHSASQLAQAGAMPAAPLTAAAPLNQPNAALWLNATALAQGIPHAGGAGAPGLGQQQQQPLAADCGRLQQVQGAPTGAGTSAHLQRAAQQEVQQPRTSAHRKEQLREASRRYREKQASP